MVELPSGEVAENVLVESGKGAVWQMYKKVSKDVLV